MTKPSSDKMDEGVQKVRFLVGTDCHLDTTITTEEFNMDTEVLRQILKINLNVEKVYVEMVPKDE